LLEAVVVVMGQVAVEVRVDIELLLELLAVVVLLSLHLLF
jgi:hypothetical protein